MSDAKIPAGWYPDPQDTTSDPRPERWWDGTGWTATTRSAGEGDPVDDTAVDETPVIEGEVPGEVSSKKPSVLKRLSKPVVIAAAVAGLLGLGIGSGATYLAVHRDGGQVEAKPVKQRGAVPGQKHGQGGSGNGFPGFPGFPGGGAGGGAGGGMGGPGSSTLAVDLRDGVSLPIPAGWKGGTVGDGSASLVIGSYDCPGSKAGAADCSLGGVNTGPAKGADPQVAAKADIAMVAKDSYGNIKSHEELKSEQVTVAGRTGYLVRWKVGAEKGNDGYVESVVFPAANGKSLVALRFGFDIADKAPDVSVMDTIVQGVADFTSAGAGASTGGPGTNT